MLKGYISMIKIQEMEKIVKAAGIRIAVVQVKLGESIIDAWHRHLLENPEDASVRIKIFNQPVLQSSSAGFTS
jgi:hypothetical protein